MRTRQIYQFSGAYALGVLFCTLAGGSTPDQQAPATGASGATAYEQMASLDEYLISSVDTEVALARSAAPAAISGKATVLTLEPQGYVTAVNGSNGFTCIVERSWMAPFDNPEFWNPKLRAPICYNPAASKSVLVYTLQRTKLALAGHSRAQMLDEVRAAVAGKAFPSPEPGAMSYMMSKNGYLGDGQGHWHSHLMFHVPKAEAASWGANLPGSPVVLDVRLLPEPQSIFLVPVARWSDGTEAPSL
jgi:hypothetical protein